MAACFTILLLFCEHAYQVTFLPVVVTFVDVCPVVGNGIVVFVFVIAVAIRGVVFVDDVQYVAFGVPGECFFLSVPVVPSCAVGIEAIGNQLCDVVVLYLSLPCTGKGIYLWLLVVGVLFSIFLFIYILKDEFFKTPKNRRLK